MIALDIYSFRLEGLKKQYMMPHSEAIQIQMRNKVTKIYQSGKGYKAIAEALDSSKPQ